KVKETATAKFDETVDLAINLGVDPKKQDQLVRGTVTLPYGTGKKIRILVLTRGEKEKEALDAGADYVGFDEYINKIKDGWLDFDVVVATPDVMSEVGKLGKILGTKGLMPSPKTGTVTFEVGQAVKSLKAGKIQIKTDKTGNVHTIVGKVSFENEKLEKNVIAVISELLKLRPATVKGQYIRSATLSATMGPGFKLDVKELMELARKET
ncbi:MAG: 50S ribosomal protein L1, partial [candidate division WOR-3 bacterium]|nr:50S ribosomal protein L1 [candidate division WOR-3 bacterium]